MAAMIEKSCNKCGKTGGTLFCNGCQQTLCFKHVNEHREEIEKEFEYLIKEEKEFEEKISNESNDSHHLFSQIDKWKKESIDHIKDIAKQAKHDLRELINQSNEQLLKFSHQIKENIHLLKESEDLCEIEIHKLLNELNELKKEENCFELIKSSDSNFLKIEKHQMNSISQCEPLSNDHFQSNVEQIHSNRQGSISIKEIDSYGHFILIEHSGSKDQDMVGWTIKRSIDCHHQIIYRFPNNFILKSKSNVKILSRKASETIYSSEKKNILIAHSILNWGTGVKTIVNHLIDANGDQTDVLTQTF